MLKKIYLQVKDYDGTENSETSITWSPARVNDSDVEYLLPDPSVEERIKLLEELCEAYRATYNWARGSYEEYEQARQKIKDIKNKLK
jgi:hypothetical protein